MARIRTGRPSAGRSKTKAEDQTWDGRSARRRTSEPAASQRPAPLGVLPGDPVGHENISALISTVLLTRPTAIRDPHAGVWNIGPLEGRLGGPACLAELKGVPFRLHGTRDSLGAVVLVACGVPASLLRLPAATRIGGAGADDMRARREVGS